MIARARVSGRFKTNSIIPSLTLLLSGAFAASVVGATLGALGAALGPAARWLLYLTVGVAIVLTAVCRERPWQVDRETPQRWLAHSGSTVVILNGIVLGTGFLSRQGTWLFYTVPLSAFVTGDVILGALLYMSYGATRLLFSITLAHRRLRNIAFEKRASIRRTTITADLFLLTFVLGSTVAQSNTLF